MTKQFCDICGKEAIDRNTLPKCKIPACHAGHPKAPVLIVRPLSFGLENCFGDEINSYPDICADCYNAALDKLKLGVKVV